MASDDIEDFEIPEEVEKSPVWLVSFGDVTALMLTFFVMLFSMSHIQSERWDAVIALISTRINPEDADQPTPSSELNIASVNLLNALPTAYINRIFKEKLANDEVLKESKITELDGQVVISVPSDVLFRVGRAGLLPRASQSISRLSGVLSQIGNRIEVQGHTDPDPPLQNGFENNWSLSLARALNVANALTDAGYPGDLSAIGLADSAYRHLDPAIPEDRRYELSRRIDLVILPDASGQ